jgi:hypothetical protein
MTLSAKWSTVSLVAAMALGAGAFAFSGCTVTSGTIDDDGGRVRPDSGQTDSGTATDSGTDDAVAPVCEGNAQTTKLVSDECQACMDQNCCDELKGCFNQTDVEVSCNDYADCLAPCFAPGVEDAAACIEERGCNDATDESIITAYEAMITCGGANDDCAAACGIATE